MSKLSVTLATDGVTRYLTAEVKTRAAGADTPPGSFEAYASAYGIDYQVDENTFEQIAAGALADTGVIPVFYQHGGPIGQRWMFPPIGAATKNDSDDRGLRSTGQLFVEEGGPDVVRVYRSMEVGALREWSIGFRPTQVRTEKMGKGNTREIVEAATVYEISTVVRGANPGSSTISVRSIEDLVSQLTGRKDFDAIVERGLAALDAYIASRGAREPVRTRAPQRLQPGQAFMTEEELERTFRLVARGGLSEADAVKEIRRRATLYMPRPYTPDPDETIPCPGCGCMNDTDATYCDQCGSYLAGRFIAPDPS